MLYQVLKDAGRHLSLCSYEPALDHLLRSMSRMGLDFDLKMGDTFISTPQVLRAVGAPGLGKSTFIDCAWSLLGRRLAEVKADEERWQRWKRLGGNILEGRLVSWNTSFGSLVFKIDMSNPCECRSAFAAEPGSSLSSP